MIRRIAALVALAWLPAASVAGNTPLIADVLNGYARETGVPVAELDAGELAALENGSVVYRKVRVARGGAGDDTTTMRIIGYRVIDKPRESLWLAALAFDGGYSSRLTEHLVATHDDGGASWYQHVDMPWPLRDRHWLIRTGKGLSLADRYDGQIWEHHWRLAPDAARQIDRLLRRVTLPGLPAARARKAIDLPLNNGAWVMASIAPQRTLVVLHATMDMGGIIPDALVNRYTRRQLESMLTRIEVNADGAHERYDSNYIIYRGDGTPIEPSPTAAAAR